MLRKIHIGVVRGAALSLAVASVALAGMSAAPAQAAG